MHRRPSGVFSSFQGKNMKKTLTALAAATAMCGASAASVTLYGVVDTGFAYNNVESDGYAFVTEDDSFSMKSG